MRKIVRAMAVVAALAFAPSAMAQIALDVKAGWAIPTGNATVGNALSSGVSGGIPLEVAGRYKFTPNLSAGLYFQWGPSFVKSSVCDVGVSCAASDMRLGIEAVYGFSPGAMNPWVSLGTGWEWSFFSASGGGATASASTNGWEYFNVQAGVDFPLSKLFALGPYVGYFGGTYTSSSITSQGQTVSGSIPSSERAFHGWIQIGAKGTFNL